MNSQISKWVVLAAMVLLVLQVPVQAQAPRPAAAAQALPFSDCLPDSTLLYLGWAGKTELMDQSITGQLLNEPALAEIVQALKAAAIKEMHGDEKTQMLKDGLALGDIVWRHPIAIALLDVQVGKVTPKPSVALLIDLGKDRKAFDDSLQSILAKLPIEPRKETAGDVAYQALPTPIGIEVAYGYVGDKFFLTVGDQTAKQIIELVGSPRVEKRLAARLNRLYAASKRDASKIQLATYIDVATLLNKGDTLMTAYGLGRGARTAETSGATTAPVEKGPSEFRRIVAALGLEGVTTIYGALEFPDKGAYTWMRIVSPGPHKGVLSLFAGAPLKDGDLAGIPEDADFAAVGRLDLKALLGEVKQAVPRIEPHADKMLQRGLQEIDQAIGMSLEDDVLGNLGDTWTISSASSQGGFLTGTVASVSVKDPEKFKTVVAKLEDLLRKNLPSSEPANGTAVRMHGPFGGMKMQFKIKSASYGDLDVHYINLMVCTPAWAVHKDRFYVALWPQVLSTAISQSPRKPLLKSPDFVKVRAKVSPNASMISYVNVPQIVRPFYGMGLMYWTMAATMLQQGAGVEVSPASFPTLDKFEKYLWPHIRAVSSDKDGILFEGYGALPDPGAIAPVTIPVAASILIPSLSKARHMAKRAASAQNLNMIGRALAIYANNNNDQFPPDLETLVRDKDITEQMLISPVSGRKDYVYIPGPRFDKDDDVMIAYERLENYRHEGTNVLYRNSSVEWMTPDRFDTVLTETNKILSEHK